MRSPSQAKSTFHQAMERHAFDQEACADLYRNQACAMSTCPCIHHCMHNHRKRSKFLHISAKPDRPNINGFGAFARHFHTLLPNLRWAVELVWLAILCSHPCSLPRTPTRLCCLKLPLGQQKPHIDDQGCTNNLCHII